MVRLNCSGIRFGSKLDEEHLFTWAVQIPDVEGWDQDTLVVKDVKISDESLRELIALFHRYNIPMAQLKAFLCNENQSWFQNPAMYWYENVF